MLAASFATVEGTALTGLAMHFIIIAARAVRIIIMLIIVAGNSYDFLFKSW